MTHALERANNPKTHLATEYNASRNEGEADWAGTRTYEEAITLVTKGWPDGLAKVQESVKQIKTKLPIEKTFMPLFDVAGAVPDVERFIMGEPECMMDFTPDLTAKRIINITVCISGLADVPAQLWIDRGAVIAAVIDHLESINIRVELDLIMCSRVPANRSAGGDESYIKIRLKDADQHMELERLAFAVGHPAMFRRIGFAIKEDRPREIRDKWGVNEMGGYGSTIGVPRHMAGELTIQELKAGQVWNHDSVMTMVNDAIDALNNKYKGGD